MDTIKQAQYLRNVSEALGEDHDDYHAINSVADEFECVGGDAEQLQYANDELAYIDGDVLLEGDRLNKGAHLLHNLFSNDGTVCFTIDEGQYTFNNGCDYFLCLNEGEVKTIAFAEAEGFTDDQLRDYINVADKLKRNHLLDSLPGRDAYESIEFLNAPKDDARFSKVSISLDHNAPKTTPSRKI